MTIRTRTIAAAVTAALASLGAAQTASAYNFTSSAGGPAVPVGTAFTASGGALTFQNAATGSNWITCTGTALGGATGGSVGHSDSLDIASGSFANCRGGSQRVLVTSNVGAQNPWSIVATSGSNSPFGGEFRNVDLTLRLGSSSATPFRYSGTLTSGVALSNAAPGSKINLTSAGTLTKSGSGAAAAPATVSLTQDIAVTSVGGSPVSPTNNLWLNP